LITAITGRARDVGLPSAQVASGRTVAMGGAGAANVPRARAGVRAVDPRVACDRARDAGLLVHRVDPLNAETPLPVLSQGAVVPSDRFYVRNHFGIPALDPDVWRLRVGGLAARPLELSLAGLRARTPVTVVATLECAGNGRSLLDPPVPGEPWGLGAVGTAAWTGVPLTEVLDRAGPLADARAVVFRGADSGPAEGRNGPVAFERALALGYLKSAGAVLAYAMNGAPLPAEHGFPVRLIVPGWYGVASVKWLTDIELTGRPFGGHFQVDLYRIGGELLTVQAVRSVITQPRPGEALPPGEAVIAGLAWSGAAPIAKVEVSIGGQPWQLATLTGDQHPHAGRRWQLAARLEAPGSITIRARATDAAGRTQPGQPRWNLNGYAANPVHHVQVSVRSPADEPRPGKGAASGASSERAAGGHRFPGATIPARLDRRRHRRSRAGERNPDVHTV
jgi:DMSO/TMAO reductase YedYZ molybdopterin-dependent catalytic subunit